MNFALILFILLVITGVIKLFDALIFRKRRVAEYGADEQAHRPWWIEYSLSFFPVILFVFVLRSFLFEPFRIPSGSMLPTLQNGDMILVNKFTYGIRLPIIDQEIIPINTPQRGDVMVFRYPVNPDMDFIKRVVGVPGDEVVYQNKRLTINGQAVPVKRVGPYVNPSQQSGSPEALEENLGNHDHAILNMPGMGALLGMTTFPGKENCQYQGADFRCTVPQGQYFVMGDNRDNSEDSRYWGFVPDRNIVGKAFFIWMNFGDLGRIGSFK
ncbi:signal peptidase [Advenella kashmirensis W13003]|uniref:Signal peptidase I n=1 Tax=Advenella kashmirensis W13003 TaxID=1424334 RepID=V8QPX6_9BURK|nr:signal peptidase I [Advenella kashmirensis]ETF01692.1 signal peptidase [Advenella kashmirensis W13003]